jgi:hypothetical protein
VENEDHHRACRPRRTVELLGDVEAALAAEIEIDQRHIGTELLETSTRISAR